MAWFCFLPITISQPGRTKNTYFPQERRNSAKKETETDKLLQADKFYSLFFIFSKYPDPDARNSISLHISQNLAYKGAATQARLFLTRSILTCIKKYLPLFSIRVATQQAFMKHLFFRTSQQTFLMHVKIDACQNPVWPTLKTPSRKRPPPFFSHKISSKPFSRKLFTYANLNFF